MPSLVRIGSSLFVVTMTLAMTDGCSLGGPSGVPSTRSPDNAVSGDCAATFRAWVDSAASLNSPGADMAEVLTAGERLERQVFDSCTLEEAERFNGEMPVERAPGFSEPMIQPDFRTFAEVECVDESPLLDGTPLCREVGH